MKRLFAITLFLVFQIALSLSAGYWALNRYTSMNGVRTGAAYAGEDLTGMDADAATETVIRAVNEKIDSELASFLYKDTEFVFHFSEIGLEADYTNIKAALSSNDTQSYISSLLSAFVRVYGDELEPAYTVGRDAFLKKLLLMKEYIDSDPVDANIDCTADGAVTVTVSEDGAFFDAEGMYVLISEQFCADPFRPQVLDAAGGAGPAIIETIAPRVPGELIGDIDTALAIITAQIPEGYDARLVEQAAEAVNKVWAPQKGKAYDSFSFMRYLDDAGLPTDRAAREYNFVASALLHALLVSGEDPSKMEFGVRAGGSGYGGLPGMEISLAGGAAHNAGGGAEDFADFRFSNTLNGNIVIFAMASDDNLKIIVTGNSKLFGGYDVHTVTENGRVLLYRDGKRIADYPAA